LAKASDEMSELLFGRRLRFIGCSLSGHGRLTCENQLRDVGESDGVTAGDAFASELSDEIAEEEIHFVSGGEAVDVVEKLGGEDFRIDGGNGGSETVSVVGAERRGRGAVRGAMSRVDQHVAALAAGVLELALMVGVLFWGHRLAFRKIEVTR